MRLGKGGGAVSVILRNRLTFWSSHPQEGIFEHNSGRPLLHASIKHFPGIIAIMKEVQVETLSEMN
jgi:hypothetical protein